MIMPPRLRKFVLTAHVASSVGWLGAVAGFLALAVVGLTGGDAQTVRGAYLVMEPAGWFVLVPLALASLVTGIVQALGTSWGLFRHYWVVFKLLINIFATVVLLMYMQTLGDLADVAADRRTDLRVVQSASPLLHAGAALLLLLFAPLLGLAFVVARLLKRAGLFQAALAWLADLGPWAPIVFMLLYLGAALFFMPASILTLGAGDVCITEGRVREIGEHVFQVDSPAMRLVTRGSLTKTWQPFGPGRRWLNSGGALSHIVGGWQMNHILSFYSGTPFTVIASGTSLNAPDSDQVADIVKPEVAPLGSLLCDKTIVWSCL